MLSNDFCSLTVFPDFQTLNIFLYFFYVHENISASFEPMDILGYGS